MALIYKQGDLLNAPEPIIVHGCNAKGVMGSGVAKAIRAKWPKAYSDYKYVYDTEGLTLGNIVWSIIDDEGDVKYIANAITQLNYGRANKRYVSYDGIESVFRKIRNEVESIAASTPDGPPYVGIPRIGAGLANGDWEIIADIIDSVMNPYDVVVYEI
jgi:O-acetyl-ADP-ribose deacetylase (regulator of RNase III)